MLSEIVPVDMCLNSDMQIHAYKFKDRIFIPHSHHNRIWAT
jgi:hypothetical protein